MLATGQWLVLSFAVWSAPDIRAVEESLTFARQAEGMRGGVRPFDEHHEHESWAPHVLEEAGSPIWTLWTDGVPRGVLVGTIDAVRLAAWVRRELGDGGRSG